jgi:Leucine-rich repeat (LRR) protein
MTDLHKIYKLIYSCEQENIELALQLAKSIDLDIISPYRRLWEWLDEYSLVDQFPKPENEVDILYMLLNVDFLYIDSVSPSYNHKKRNFYHLPFEFAYLHFLTFLHISNPNLQEIPSNIHKIPFLKRITVNFGRFKTLPPNLFLLEKLKELQIQWTSLEEIPAEIKQLQSLETLDLSFNQLRELPSTIVELSTLRELNLTGNHFTEIPEFIYQMPRLCLVNLDENRIPEAALAEFKAYMKALHPNIESLDDIPF